MPRYFHLQNTTLPSSGTNNKIDDLTEKFQNSKKELYRAEQKVDAIDTKMDGRMKNLEEKQKNQESQLKTLRIGANLICAGLIITNITLMIK